MCSDVKCLLPPEFFGSAGATHFPLNLAFSCHWAAALLTPLQPAPRVGLWCRRERPTDQDATRTKPCKSDTLIRTVFRKATAPFSFAPYRLRLPCTEPKRYRFDFNQMTLE